MKVVGLTGGIGSGKSTVARIFQTLGIPVYNSDQRAKDLYSESSVLKSAMISNFGPDIYQEGKINRPKLAQIIFSDRAKLEVVNSLVHPLLEKDFLNWKSMQNSAYVVREAAILVESGGYKNCDYVVVVTAPVDIRVSRVVQRDRSTREDVLQRMKSQLPEEEISKHAHFCIRNNGDESLIEQVCRIHSDILKGM